MGRRLERALHTLGLLRSTLATAAGPRGAAARGLLEVADSSMTYRRRYLSSLQAAPVLDLLLADETNPRSLAFQLSALADHVDDLPRDPTHAGLSPEQQILLAARTAVRLADIDLLARPDADGRRDELDDAAGPAGGGPAGPVRCNHPQLPEPSPGVAPSGGLAAGPEQP